MKPDITMINSNRTLDLSDLAEFEILSGRAEGRSQKTVELTVLSLSKLRKFLKDRDLSINPGSIGTKEIRDFIIYLKTSRRFSYHPFAGEQDGVLSAHTINCYLRAMRAAWNRWQADGLVNESPFERVKIPRVPKKIMPAFTESQLRTLLCTFDTKTPLGFRDFSLVNVYLDTACRLSEITSVKMYDVDLKGQTLRVMGKGSRERIVTFGKTVQKLLWTYIKKYRPQPASPAEDYLFLTWDGRKLTNNRVEAIVKKYCTRAKIEGVRCSPHTLRHTACTQWIRNQGDLLNLQKLTGHSSLEVLKGYISLVTADLARAHRRYSPVDNLRRS